MEFCGADHANTTTYNHSALQRGSGARVPHGRTTPVTPAPPALTRRLATGKN